MAGTRGCSPRLETVGGVTQQGWRRAPAASSGGEDGAELGEGALQGLLRASGLLESMRCVAADVYKGSAWPGDRQRRVIAAAHRTHQRGVSGKSRARCSWTGRCRGPPGLWTPRGTSGSSCEAGGGVREVGGARAEMEGGGGRPEELRSSGELGGRRQRVYTPSQGTGLKIQPVPM